MAAQEETVQEKIRRNIVLLTAKSGKSSQNEQIIVEQRNGVIVSPAGWLLTTYGLIDGFTKIEPGSLKITAQGYATGGEPVESLS